MRGFHPLRKGMAIAMRLYQELDAGAIQTEYEKNLQAYRALQAKGLKLDMSRGKPGYDQLELSMPMLDMVSSSHDMKTLDGSDVRNYGQLEGLPETRRLFASLLGVEPDAILVGGNSSLNMMFDAINFAEALGIMGSVPWARLPKVKFLCPVPGYDRHFSICELFSIEMVPVPMGSDGPDMDMVEELVSSDETVKGIWCVPKYSNPTGITYSDDTVRRFAALRPAAADFRIYWDNAYCVHDLTDTPDSLLNLFTECEKLGIEDMVYAFASTSKISFSGAGIAVMAASPRNMRDLKAKRSIQTIGPNKINQLMHARFFRDADAVMAHMAKHRALLAPKFSAVLDALDREIAPLGIGEYTRPRGGYFLSFNTLPGCARRVGELCKKAGVTLTTVGATFPYGRDPEDRNIRIAPTFPPVSELEEAMEVFCAAVRLASSEKLTGRL